MVRQHRRHGGTFRGDAVLDLTTVGARTGKQRQNPVGYEHDEDGAWLVVASFGGAAQHPGCTATSSPIPDAFRSRWAGAATTGCGPSSSTGRAARRRGPGSPRTGRAWAATRRRPAGAAGAAAGPGAV